MTNGERKIAAGQRAAFVAQVHRRRGPKKRVAERVPTSVKLPLPVFNALCHAALVRGEPLHRYMLRTLASAVAIQLR